MIYCVVPRELVPELFDRLVDHYRDEPNVKVIVDRRFPGDQKKASNGDRAPRVERRRQHAYGAVSYTHLTLPTILRV